MSEYQKLKKLDEESLRNLKEGSGPVDKCICHLFDVPEKKGLRASVKRLFSGKKNKTNTYLTSANSNTIFVPFASGKKGGKGIYSTKEVIKNKSQCNKCKTCNNEKLVLKHSYANIKISTPDASSICPCPSDCLPEKTRNMLNNVKVTVERVLIDPDTVDSEADLNNSSSEVEKRPVPSEPRMERRSVSELIDEQYEQEDLSQSSDIIPQINLVRSWK